MEPSIITAAVAALLASPEFASLVTASFEATLASGSTAPASPTTTLPTRRQGNNASARGGIAPPTRGGTSTPSGVSELEKRIEELTKQVADLAATNSKQLNLITELTRQRQPTAQRPGGPAAQQQATAQRPGGPAAQ